jgi:hypothetical protein
MVGPSVVMYRGSSFRMSLTAMEKPHKYVSGTDLDKMGMKMRTGLNKVQQQAFNEC